MDQPQLIRRRRHARRQVLLRVLRILLVVLVATVTQVALPSIDVVKVFFARGILYSTMKG